MSPLRLALDYLQYHFLGPKEEIRRENYKQQTLSYVKFLCGYSSADPTRSLQVIKEKIIFPGGGEECFNA